MARRPIHPIPPDVKGALAAGGVEADYAGRPPYQRNDYIGWVTRAKAEATRRKRIAQMVRELKSGGLYMGVKHGPSAKA